MTDQEPTDPKGGKDKRYVRPYGDATGDGMVQLSFTLPVPHGPRGDGRDAHVRFLGHPGDVRRQDQVRHVGENGAGLRVEGLAVEHVQRRAAEMAALFAIGDGVLGAVQPRRHVDLWRSDIAAVDGLVRPFAGRPDRRRAYGLAQIAAGLVLAADPPGQAASTGEGETVKQVFSQKLPNVPGKTLTVVQVDYRPGGFSAPHRHPASGFVYAYVLSGTIRSQVEGEPLGVYSAGQFWTEPPNSHHIVSANASKTKPARLIASSGVPALQSSARNPDAFPEAAAAVPARSTTSGRAPRRGWRSDGRARRRRQGTALGRLSAGGHLLLRRRRRSRRLWQGAHAARGLSDRGRLGCRV